MNRFGHCNSKQLFINLFDELNGFIPTLSDTWINNELIEWTAYIFSFTRKRKINSDTFLLIARRWFVCWNALCRVKGVTFRLCILIVIIKLIICCIFLPYHWLIFCYFLRNYRVIKRLTSLNTHNCDGNTKLLFSIVHSTNFYYFSLQYLINV